MYSVTEYAALVGLTRQAVLKQIKAGKLKATKVGKTWVIETAKDNEKEN